MCLAIPGKVIDIDNGAGPKMGTLDFGGIRKKACLELVPEIAIGNYVIVHVGFAISIIDEHQAIKTLQLLRDIEQTNEQEQSSK